MFRQRNNARRCRQATAWLLAILPLSAMALDDPTRPPIFHEDAPSAPVPQIEMQWELTSILVAPNRRLAMINGQTVGHGDSIDGARVTAIRSDGVTLDRQGRQIELKLLPPLRTETGNRTKTKP